MIKCKDESQRPAPRLPYAPPRVVSDDVFETLALACGKVSTAVPSCRGPGAQTS